MASITFSPSTLFQVSARRVLRTGPVGSAIPKGTGKPRSFRQRSSVTTANASTSGSDDAKPTREPVVVKGENLMAFNGIAPELINGRVAMSAFVAAIGAEVVTGLPVTEQFQAHPAPVIGFVALISLATFIPKLRGEDIDPESWPDAIKERSPFQASPFTTQAVIEKWNGRAAMLGMVALLLSERCGSAMMLSQYLNIQSGTHMF